MSQILNHPEFVDGEAMESVAFEYLKCYPNETGHASVLQQGEFKYRHQSKLNKREICNDDFTPSLDDTKRCGSIMQNEPDHFLKFSQSPGTKCGDIFEPNSYPPSGKNTYQTMRNTNIISKNFVFGHNYVTIGCVDLLQLAWGRYENANTKKLIFHGYDGNRVTTLRSKIVYGIAKNFAESEISTQCLLQIWFSSCWDEDTLKNFQMVLQDALTDLGKYQLEEMDVELLKKWQDAPITVSDAKQQFPVGLEDADFRDIFGMSLKEDQVKFCRYLFTGIIFADESKVVCGNPTMFTPYQGCTKAPNEAFFKAINITVIKERERNFKVMFLSCSKESFHEEMRKSCLYDSIISKTNNKISEFRCQVNMGNIVCHLHVKVVDPTDTMLASEIKKLNPTAIEWSNIPEYMLRKDFIKFSRACSVENTVHNVYFLNWQRFVFGGSHVDWHKHPSCCISIYRHYKEFFRKGILIAMEKHHIWKYFQKDICRNPISETNMYLALYFREAFEDFFMCDENGKILNRISEKNLDYESFCNLYFFGQSPAIIRSTFTFNGKLKFL